MRYYVTADVHGFFTELKTALKEKGFFEDKQPHKLIICGDLFDRGGEALDLQEFILDLMKKEQVILIKGNHEDLLLNLLYEWHKHSYNQWHHIANGTVDTVCQLTNSKFDTINSEQVGEGLLHSPCVQKIIPSMLDYYETEKYIFVHGWIPCNVNKTVSNTNEYLPVENWRYANEAAWNNSRWINGMEAAHNKIIEKGKTIVCGHWHCSFGHANYEGKGGEFCCEPDYSPYYANGIIALDACTAKSKFVNCVIIEDNEMV